MNRVARIHTEQLNKEFGYLAADPNFATILRSYCERDGKLRYDAVASAAHLDPAYVYRLIKGDKSHPSSNTVIRLALALHLTVSQTDELLMVSGYAPLVFPGKAYQTGESSQNPG